MKCPVCFNADVVRETRDLEYNYKGKKTILQAITGEHCPACGEVIMDAAESADYWNKVMAFRQQVNATEMEPSFIARIRKNLGIDQRQAGELFGGGVNAFSRYETGKTVPPVTIVRLFKLFEKRPELFDEYRNV
ncbi:type II TA system antitoxin MqsA family protein [Escherichia coli]